MEKTIYDYTARDLSGREVKLDDYRGKVLLIVNIASKCGLTPQLDGLEMLYEKYRDQGFEILAFPSSNFFQEPLAGDGIAEFCTKNYGVTFKVMEKTNVIGFSKHPVYKFLSNKSLNGKVNKSPHWNFYKYLIDRNGKVVDSFSSITLPSDASLTKQIEACLAAPAVAA
jgi:glutathione peroxidase